MATLALFRGNKIFLPAPLCKAPLKDMLHLVGMKPNCRKLFCCQLLSRLHKTTAPGFALSEVSLLLLIIYTEKEIHLNNGKCPGHFIPSSFVRILL